MPAKAGDVTDLSLVPGSGRFPLEEEMATHSITLAWRIPWSEGDWWAVVHGSQTVGHDWSDLSHSNLVSVLKHCGVVLPVSGTLINVSYSTHSFVSATLLTLSEVKWLSHVQLFVTPWTVAYQAPPSMGFSRQEYWNELSFPSPGDLPDQRIKPGLLHWRQMLYHLSHQGNTHLFSFFRGFPLCEDFIFYLATLLFVNIPVFHLSDFKMLLWHSCTFLLDICLGVDMHMSSFIRYGEILFISNSTNWQFSQQYMKIPIILFIYLLKFYFI